MMLDFLQQYSGALTFLATLLLVALTAFYAYWTKGILSATANQARLSLSPVIGIVVKSITIGEVFGPKRRNMNVEIELSNVGNAPAIELLVDAEVTLRHSSVKGKKVIPARFEPSMISFLRQGEQISERGVSLCFGNTFITHFFDDVREAHRLNLHRIETDPTQESFNTSRLRVIAYYRNSLGQQFRSYYEVEICFWHLNGTKPFPADNETCEVDMSNIPRPVFHAEPIAASDVDLEIRSRNAKRELSGW
ncbi:MAG: hypothetical protein ACXW0Q_10015 [Methylovulum sp.]